MEYYRIDLNFLIALQTLKVSGLVPSDMTQLSCRIIELFVDDNNSRVAHEFDLGHIEKLTTALAVYSVNKILLFREHIYPRTEYK